MRDLTVSQVWGMLQLITQEACQGYLIKTKYEWSLTKTLLNSYGMNALADIMATTPICKRNVLDLQRLSLANT